MLNQNSRMRHVVIGVIGMILGAGIALGWCTKRYHHDFVLAQCMESDDLIRYLDLLNSGDAKKATLRLEMQLNTEILILTTGESPHVKPVNEDAREVLRRVARYRANHPFEAKSQTMNRMIQEALASAQ